jgi:hypothetical protein
VTGFRGVDNTKFHVNSLEFCVMIFNVFPYQKNTPPKLVQMFVKWKQKYDLIYLMFVSFYAIKRSNAMSLLYATTFYFVFGFDITQWTKCFV